MRFFMRSVFGTESKALLAAATLGAAAVAFGVGVGCGQRQAPAPPAPAFADLVRELSEQGGYFDTDNLISNETSYAEVVQKLEPTGGVYVGVGPEQNFHYMGRLRPSWAFIVDVRRDNMLHHLLLNALLSSSETPYDYLCNLFARDCGDGSAGERSFDGFAAMVAAFEAAEPSPTLFEDRLAAVFAHIETKLEFPLGEKDRETIEFIYRSFFDEQLALRFRSYGRPPMPHHPTYRQLLLAKGTEGMYGHFLARPDDYAHVRGLARSGKLVPVVGDFAGDHALRAIARLATEQQETVSAFYLSNVEFYLIRGGSYSAFVENVRSLPIDGSSLLVRAYFGYGYRHPEALPGHRSTVIRQRAERFLKLYDEGAYRSFWDVSTLDYEH